MSRDMLISENGPQGVMPPVPPMGNLEKLRHYSHDDTGTPQQYQGRPAPYQAVDGIIDSGDYVDHCFLLINYHSYDPFKLINSCFTDPHIKRQSTSVIDVSVLQ